MKVGFFTDSYFPEIDGVTYTIDNWAREMERLGHEVHVVYPDADHEPGERGHPVPSIPNPFYSGYPIPLFRRTSTLPDFDLVHCHGPATVGLLGRYYAWRNDLPAIYTHHTPLEEYFEQSLPSSTLPRLLAAAYVPLESAFLRTFDVATASTGQIDRSVEHVELPVGVDLEFFEPTDAPCFVDEFDRPVIGYSGRASMEKNLADVLDLAERLPEYQFVVVGEGPRREHLEATAPENVAIRDFLPRERLPAFYSSIDVFVTASTGDTLGLSTLEANACGTPVAAADVAPFDRTIGCENGARFEYGDLDAMTAAVEDCLAGDRDTRSAVESYAMANTVEALESLYDALTSAEETAVSEIAASFAFSSEGSD